MIARRTLLAGALAFPLAPVAAAPAAPLAVLEARRGGRIGVMALDTATGRVLARRADERFPMCSTFKFLLAALALRRVDEGRERLDRIIPITQADIIANSPVTGRHVAGGMTMAALCEATMTLSDNAAANLLLAQLGGPPAVTALARELRDRVTRLDRSETALNSAIPGDPRDTTSPRAMIGLMRRLLLGDVLSARSREQLTAWMTGATTGLTALRAGVPSGWRAGDKTGAGDHGTRNDIAIFWPPGRAPIVVAAFFTGTDATLEQGNATMAEIGRIVAGRFA